MKSSETCKEELDTPVDNDGKQISCMFPKFLKLLQQDTVFCYVHAIEVYTINTIPLRLEGRRWQTVKAGHLAHALPEKAIRKESKI